jgi:hypothetical protein
MAIAVILGEDREITHQLLAEILNRRPPALHSHQQTLCQRLCLSLWNSQTGSLKQGKDLGQTVLPRIPAHNSDRRSEKETSRKCQL